MSYHALGSLITVGACAATLVAALHAAAWVCRRRQLRASPHLPPVPTAKTQQEHSRSDKPRRQAPLRSAKTHQERPARFANTHPNTTKHDPVCSPRAQLTLLRSPAKIQELASALSTTKIASLPAPPLRCTANTNRRGRATSVELRKNSAAAARAASQPSTPRKAKAMNTRVYKARASFTLQPPAAPRTAKMYSSGEGPLSVAYDPMEVDVPASPRPAKTQDAPPKDPISLPPILAFPEDDPWWSEIEDFDYTIPGPSRVPKRLVYAK